MQVGNSTTIPLSLPICSLPLINPVRHIAHWVAKGIITVANLMVRPTLKTFRAVQFEYGLEDSDQYQFLQVDHFLHASLHTSTLLPQRIALYFTKPPTNIKVIFLFYNTLNNKMIFTKSSKIKAWEQNLYTSYTSEQWQKALHTTYAATKSVNL